MDTVAVVQDEVVADVETGIILDEAGKEGGCESWDKVEDIAVAESVSSASCRDLRSCPFAVTAGDWLVLVLWLAFFFFFFFFFLLGDDEDDVGLGPSSAVASLCRCCNKCCRIMGLRRSDGRFGC